MDLTPEQRAVGKENFCAAIGKLRKDFLRAGIQQDLASGKGLGSHYYGYEKSISSPLRVGVIGTGDEGCVLLGACNPDFIQVAAIADIRPYSIYRAFHGHYNRAGNLIPSRPGLLNVYPWSTEEEARKHVKVYEGKNGDYRNLIANAKEDDIEAVIIALPLHLHAEAAVAAMKAGLHVLTEKLMAHSVHECKEMARIAEQRGLHLVTGHQRHYNILYDNADYLIRRGLLGDLHYIRAQWHRGNLPGNDSWQQPLPPGVKSLEEDPEADFLTRELDSWKKSLGKNREALKKLEAKLAGEGEKLSDSARKQIERAIDSQKREVEKCKRMIPQLEKQIEDKIVEADKLGYKYAEWKMEKGKIYRRPAIEELIRWRLWDRTGGGLMAELGSHQLDAASIFISAMFGGKKQYPLNVNAMASRPIFPADRDVEDHVYCLFEFPAPDYDPNDEIARQKKITVAYASINGNGFGGYGEAVFGTEGTLLLDREKEALLYRTHEVSTKIRVTDSKDENRPGPIMVPADEGDPISAAIGTQALGTDVSRGYREELEHWAWCIRNPAPENVPHCHPKVALADAVIALTANIAAAKGQTIQFKKEWFDPQRDETPEEVKPDLSRYA